MRRVVFVAAALSLVIGSTWNVSRGDDTEKPKYTIKDVMQKAHKSGLMKKIASGQGTEDDAKQLVEMYKALGENKPPKGDEASWKEKTHALLEAAEEVVKKEPGAGAKLEKAANCGNCHKEHKPA